MTPPPRLISALSLVALLLTWSALSLMLQDPQILPQPQDVLAKIVELSVTGKLLPHLSDTAVRVVAAFLLAMSLGTVLGYFMGRSKSFNAWLDPWLIVFLNLPALVLIVLCYLWIGLNEMAAIVAVTLNKAPLVITIIREGARNSNESLRDLAKVYRLERWSKIKHIILPELFPYLVTAARTGLSLIWKIVLVVEFLGRGTGVGRQIHTQFSIFNVTGVLAYALSFVVLVLCVELFIMQPLERRANRWKHNDLT